MRGIALCAACCVVAGCDASVCEPRRAAPSSGSAPAMLRAAVVLPSPSASPAPGAVRPDGGVVCLTCNGIAILDAAFHERHHIDTSGPPRLAVAPDGAIYVALPAVEPDGEAVIALSPSGEERWRTAIPSDTGVASLVAGAEGPYVRLLRPGTAGSPLIVGFDAATGESRTVATDEQLLAAAHDGVVTVASESQGSVTLRRRQPDGELLWSRTLGSSSIGVDRARARADGSGDVVSGVAVSMVDFGDRVLAPLGLFGRFVAGFDAAGATQWAFAHESFQVRDVAFIGDDQLLLAGNSGGTFAERTTDAHVELATPSGVERTINITGPGNQVLAYVGAAPDGAVVVQVENVRSRLTIDEPVMHIGEAEYASPGVYLLELAP